MEQQTTTTEPLVFEQTYNAPISKVWQAISNKDKMKEWYFDVPDFKPEVGCDFSFTAGSAEKKFLHLCKVTKVIPGKLLAYTWRYDEHEGDSEVTWELFDEAGQTRLKLTHTGLHTLEPTADFARNNFVKGWTHFTTVALPNYLDKE